MMKIWVPMSIFWVKVTEVKDDLHKAIATSDLIIHKYYKKPCLSSIMTACHRISYQLSVISYQSVNCSLLTDNC
jgi:hypothetical protein